MPADGFDFGKIYKDGMESFGDSRIDSMLAGTEDGQDEPSGPLNPTYPSCVVGPIPNNKRMTSGRQPKTQIPAEVFLARLCTSRKAPLLQFSNQPFRYIVSKTSGIYEIGALLGRIECGASECDDRSSFIAHLLSTVCQRGILVKRRLLGIVQTQRSNELMPYFGNPARKSF